MEGVRMEGESAQGIEEVGLGKDIELALVTAALSADGTEQRMA